MISSVLKPVFCQFYGFVVLTSRRSQDLAIFVPMMTKQTKPTAIHLAHVHGVKIPDTEAAIFFVGIRSIFIYS